MPIVLLTGKLLPDFSYRSYTKILSLRINPMKKALFSHKSIVLVTLFLQKQYAL